MMGLDLHDKMHRLASSLFINRACAIYFSCQFHKESNVEQTSIIYESGLLCSH